MGCNNPEGRIGTPHIDALATRGVRMTDAHATSAVCTPSRYSVLTGRYAWRSRLERGIVWPWDGALIEPGRVTVAELLRRAGFRTACLGKWHLGWEWPTRDGSHPNDTLAFGRFCDDDRAAYEHNIDYHGRIGGGPVDAGFDSYFGVDVPNSTPYTWFEDDRVVDVPSEPKPDLYGHPGRAVPGWRYDNVLPALAERAVGLIEEAAASDAPPLFLYLALTSPHSPIAPSVEFEGASGIGGYGDFVCETDALIGELVEALDRTGQFDDTLLLITSDNGPELTVADDEGAYERARRTGHFSMGPLRGAKLDAWEGGHRVPFIATWPAEVPAGTRCDALVSLADLMATAAQITGQAMPPDVGEDSVSMLPLLRGEPGPTRTSMVLHSGGGTFAYREADWVLIDGSCGGDRS